MNALLRVENLTAGYGRRKVVSDLTLTPISQGSLTALVGPNGAGKTTLLRAMAGIAPATGTLSYGAHDLLALSAAARARVMSFMPQATSPQLVLTVFESVMSALRASPVAGPADGSSPDWHDASIEILIRLGIADLAHKPFDRLSGGQRQLASLAQALVRKPKLLLLDEPTSALDLRHHLHVMSLVRDYAKSGCTVVAVLHDLQAAARWADRVIVLKNGALYSEGRANESVTPRMLEDVYGVSGRIENLDGELHIASLQMATDVCKSKPPA